MIEIVDLITDPKVVISVLTAVAAFATIIMLFLPYVEGDKLSSRMKYVSTERDRMREQRLAELNSNMAKGNLRGVKAKGYMQRVVDSLQLREALESGNLKDKLRMAGFRGQGPIVAFLFFRIALPLTFFLLAILYLFLIRTHGHTPMMRVLFAIGAAYAGFFLPNIFLSNLIQKRQKSIKQAFPDALDLLLICVQSGMSAEASFAKVAQEVGVQSIELAEELSITTAELSYLSDRRQAYENLGIRTGLQGVKAVCTSLVQAERYGTPLGQALRVMAQENRDMRMADAEKKAAALPPKLTVPMILFFLPVLFVVILGPAALKVMAIQS
ncbi:MAG: type II secretion system F family protein [Methyloligellaceae bacterium]